MLRLRAKTGPSNPSSMPERVHEPIYRRNLILYVEVEVNCILQVNISHVKKLLRVRSRASVSTYVIGDGRICL
jgi:hypothetical protein